MSPWPAGRSIMDHLGVKVCYIRKWPFFTGKMNEEDDKDQDSSLDFGVPYF